MKRRILLAPLLAIGLMAAEPASAPDQPLPDAAQEQRARALFTEIRCVVCQHEAIADSPAGVAADMRRLVRDEIAAGATDEQVRQGLVRRFGDYVLFRPPLRIGTLLLWFGPLLLASSAALTLVRRGRRKKADPLPLSPEEERRLHELFVQESVRRDPDATSPHDGR